MNPVEFADPFQVFRTMPGPRRLLLFDGAPGSGRIFLATITAAYLADCGYRTLLVAADPPAWLEQAFGAEIAPSSEPIEAVPRLWALQPERSENPFTRDLHLLAQLAFLLDTSDFDFIAVDRAPGLEAVSRVADACQRWQEVETASGLPIDPRWPSDRQWRTLLPRLWDSHTTMLVAVAAPCRFDPDGLVRKMEETVAAGIRPGLLVANRLPEVKTPGQPSPPRRRGVPAESGRHRPPLRRSPGRHAAGEQG